MSEKKRKAYVAWLRKPRPGFPKGWTYEYFGKLTWIGYSLAAHLGTDAGRNEVIRHKNLRLIYAECPDCPLVEGFKPE